MKAICTICILLAMVAATASCEYFRHPEPFGASVRAYVKDQKLDPTAGSTLPVTGLDGQKAGKVVQNYRQGSSGQNGDSSPQEFVFQSAN